MPLEQLAARRHLARQRLAHLRERADRSACSSGRAVSSVTRPPPLGAAAAGVLERAPVEALDELHARLADQRPEQAAARSARRSPRVSASTKQTSSPVSTLSARHIASPLPSTGPKLGHQLGLAVDLGAEPAAIARGAVGRVGVDDDDLVDDARLAQRDQRRDDGGDRRGLLAGGHADRDRLRARGSQTIGRKLGVVEAAQRHGARTMASGLSVAPDTQPWSALLDAGRADERLVREAFEGARAAVVRPLPETLHPALLGALRGAGIELALRPPGRGAGGRAGRGRRSSRPAPRRASRCASTCRRSTSCAATPRRARCTSTRRRRSPRTRRARSTRSA